MSKTNVVRPAALVLLLVLQAPLTWGAPSAAEKAEAEALFQDAKKLMGQKRFTEACQKFEASQKLDPAGGTLLNLALCHEAEGKLATAWVEFGDALNQAKQDKKNDRIKIAREHLEKLEPRLPKLVVKLARGAPPGLVVERDGVAMSSASFGTAIPVDPGERRVKASAPGFLPVEERISVAEGETKTLTLPELSPEPQPEVPAVSSALPPPPLPPPSNQKTLAYIAGGVGMASLAVGTFFGLRTLSKKSESDKECPSASTCSARGVQANEEAYTSATVANIGVGLGIVGLGAAAYLLLMVKPGSSASSYRVTPALGQNGGGLWMQGHF